MIIPCRCFSCGALISDKWISYVELTNKYRLANKNVNDIELLDADILKTANKKETAEFKALKDLNVTRICCRRHFLTNVDLIDSI